MKEGGFKVAIDGQGGDEIFAVTTLIPGLILEGILGQETYASYIRVTKIYQQ